jgi:hypothetical protein
MRQSSACPVQTQISASCRMCRAARSLMG